MKCSFSGLILSLVTFNFQLRFEHGEDINAILCWFVFSQVRAGPNLRRRWRTWKLDSVHELLKRQYQLRPVAIELFSVNGSNDLLVFHKNERDEVFKNLLAQNLPRNSM